jgi:prefoldin subunit 5
LLPQLASTIKKSKENCQKLSKSCQKVVKKLSKGCQKVSKSCQKVVKKLSKNVKKLSKNCQKSVKNLSKIIKKVVKKLSKGCQKMSKSWQKMSKIGQKFVQKFVNNLPFCSDCPGKKEKKKKIGGSLTREWIKLRKGQAIIKLGCKWDWMATNHVNISKLLQNFCTLRPSFWTQKS